MARRAAARVATLLVVGVLAASCADTVVDVESADVESTDGETSNGDTSNGDTSGSSDTVATTTLPITGSGAELLAEMSSEMSALSAQIGDEGDEKATLVRIDSIWAVARVEVESTRPELVGGIDTTVDMARTAVVRIRPADADKAFQLLTDLVDRYTNDG